jgi:chemotaxis protein histidine kinase CheA/CheY-like chemotaxis protein
MAEQHDRILGYFLEEANEHLDTIEQGLRKLAETVKQPATIRELFRAAHSIKGSAAMLGLTDVQQVSNQFEANFRLLKEQPQIEVDNQLQSLFLESFSFLRAAISDAKAANDPNRRERGVLDPVGDPVFEELKSYLQSLLDRTNPAHIKAPVRSPNLTQDPALEQVFGEYVTRKLGEITSLCRQPDRPEIRAQIQKICHKLGNLGENFDFLEWTNLFTACRLAIANPQNTLPQLAENISIAVKQAQRLVLADRHQSIAITSDLRALIDPRQSEQFSESIPSTFKVENPYDRFAGNKIDGDVTTENFRAETVPAAKFQPGSNLVSPFNLDASDEFSNFFTTKGGLGFESGSTDELMGVFDDDLLNDSTWMAEDLINTEITPKNSTDAITDLSAEQLAWDSNLASSLVQPVPQQTEHPQSFDLVTPEIPSTPATKVASEIIQLQNPVEYDEETFYTPEPEDIEDRDLANFWSDLQSAEPSPPLYSDLDRSDNAGYQFQPDLPPALELDISAPDFSLDPPLSEIFPIGIPSTVNETIEPTESILADDDAEDRQLLDLPDRVDSTVGSPHHESSFINLTPTTDAADLPVDRTPISEDELDDLLDLHQPQGIELEALPVNREGDRAPISEDELVDDLLDLHQSQESELVQPNEQNSLRQDVLLFEELNGDQLPASMISEDGGVDELTSFDRASEQHKSDDFIDSELNSINSIEPISGILNYNSYNSFLDLDLNPSISNELVELDLNSLEYSSNLGSSIDDDLAELDLNLLGVDDDSGSSIDDDLAELDLSSQSSGELDRFELDLLSNTKPDRDLPDDNSFASLDLNSLEDRDVDLAAKIDIPATHPVAETVPPSIDQTDKQDKQDKQSFDRELAELDLDLLVNTESVDRSPSIDDIAELDLNVLTDESDLGIELAQSFNLENLAELNFNFDGIDSNLASDDLKDLEGMLDANPAANLGDVEHLDLLLGTAALGIGGAIAVGGGELDALDDLIGSPAPVTSSETNLDDLDRLLAVPTPVAAPPQQPTAKKTTDRRSKQRTFEQTMRVSVRHLDNLNNLVGELVVSRNTLEQDQNRMRQFVEKLLSEVQRLNDVGKRMQDLYERSLMENSLIASRQQSKPISPQAQARIEDLEEAGTLMEYDPLEMDRFTPIHMLSQKMIELTVRVRESTADIEFVVDESTEVTRTLRQITGQLQEDLTKSRMVPFAQTADRLQRGVRDNGLKYGKQVELSVEGRDTLIDKVILESLTDPLIHMVNNAIAHGIESPAVRQAADKPSEGKITIRALHQGNQTIISISDDGGGISTERVKTKAIEKGIITAQKAATMTKNEVYELLFLPSFSTKDEADELAGRGVGMDVVRTSLTEIRGTITTESQLGVGTTFTIRLPLALSIAKALIAVNNKTNIAFPMDGIEDTQDISPEQIQLNNEGEQCIFWRDELMPFKPLSDLLGFNRPLPRNNLYDAQEDDSDLVSVLILHSDGNLIAVQVDKIITDREIVIKPLQGPAPKPLGIAGATVMGDGRIVPIADVMELIELAKGNLTRHVSTQWSTPMSIQTVEQRESMVLIVDDSITVRELLSLTFKRAGYRVEQARDGQEAWDKLRAGLPCDIVFCDIEMPRMDGLEFLSRVQKDVALSKVPVAMLTSRGSDRHRQIASQLGASGYFIKPYLEEALLDAAKRMIKGEVLAIV